MSLAIPIATSLENRPRLPEVSTARTANSQLAPAGYGDSEIDGFGGGLRAGGLPVGDVSAGGVMPNLVTVNIGGRGAVAVGGDRATTTG